MIIHSAMQNNILWLQSLILDPFNSTIINILLASLSAWGNFPFAHLHQREEYVEGL